MQLTLGERPIFQMRLGLGDDLQPGWIFPGEGEKDESFFSPAFTIAWRPELKFQEADYIFPGEIDGKYAHFHLQFEGGLFVFRLGKSLVRFALWDPSGPQDFRGMPFFRVFSYLGRNLRVLEYYGKSDFQAF